MGKSYGALLIAGIAIAGSALQPARAADWQINPRLMVSGVYDDNYRLDPVKSNAISVEGAAVEASAQFLYDDPRTRFDFTPKLRSTFYPSETQEQANDQFFDLNFLHRWEKATFALAGDYWRQIILRNYLPTTDIDNGLGKPTLNTDIGPVTLRNRQEFAMVAPSATFELSPIRRLLIDTQILDVTYSDQISGLREDFKNYRSGVGLAMDLTPTSTATVRGTAAQYRPDVGANANTYGVAGQWNFRQTQLMQSYVRLGADHTQFDQAANATAVPGVPATTGGSTSANSFSGGVGTSRKYQLTDIFVDLTRSVSPNSGGTVVAQDELRIRVERKFGPRLAGFVAARGIKERALGNNTLFDDDRYATASLGFEWRLYRQFSVTSQYIYTSQKTNSYISAANSNSVFVTFIYQPNRLAQDAPILND